MVWCFIFRWFIIICCWQKKKIHFPFQPNLHSLVNWCLFTVKITMAWWDHAPYMRWCGWCSWHIFTWGGWGSGNKEEGMKEKAWIKSTLALFLKTVSAFCKKNLIQLESLMIKKGISLTVVFWRWFTSMLHGLHSVYRWMMLWKN